MLNVKFPIAGLAVLVTIFVAGCSATSGQETPFQSTNTPPETITPPQMEGPYYPVEKPADRDSDLLVVAGSDARPAGETLVLNGVVYDASGKPVADAVVEIWQTDSSGAYMHPDDPNTETRDRNFQFYGESRTGADGVYSFRTLLPGLYGGRPRHIHVKVRLDDAVVLTTQFYFANETSLTGVEANLLVDTAPAEDDEGHPIWVGARDIVLNMTP